MLVSQRTMSRCCQRWEFVGIDAARTAVRDLMASEAARYPLIEKFDNLQSCWQGIEHEAADERPSGRTDVVLPP